MAVTTVHRRSTVTFMAVTATVTSLLVQPVKCLLAKYEQWRCERHYSAVAHLGTCGEIPSQRGDGRDPCLQELTKSAEKYRLETDKLQRRASRLAGGNLQSQNQSLQVRHGAQHTGGSSINIMWHFGLPWASDCPVGSDLLV